MTPSRPRLTQAAAMSPGVVSSENTCVLPSADTNSISLTKSDTVCWFQPVPWQPAAANPVALIEASAPVLDRYIGGGDSPVVSASRTSAQLADGRKVTKSAPFFCQRHALRPPSRYFDRSTTTWRLATTSGLNECPV